MTVSGVCIHKHTYGSAMFAILCQIYLPDNVGNLMSDRSTCLTVVQMFEAHVQGHL